MPTVDDLSALLAAADDHQEPALREVARKCGLLWQCRNAACLLDNARLVELCDRCGHDRQGRPLADHRPGLYPVPDKLWEALREHLHDWIATTGLPVPDAVTFRYLPLTGAEWEVADPVFHYGGRTETIPVDLSGTEIEEDLDDIADEAEPSHCESLRITLRS
ncbi:hypothetical protein ACIQU6_38450 [Streptomyces sp. NPDC090442]|uniref:hypothetical protein n=1 Tax=Streptomyces sp. NPDC090442 TaxID=3365962 RepID=UPI0037FC04A9